MIEKYYTYSFIIIAMSVGSIAWEVSTAKKNENNLRSLAKEQSYVTVVRNGIVQSIESIDLVVGDAVVLESQTIAVCDMVVVRASSVVTDESSITGETIPVVKYPVSIDRATEEFSIEKHKKHVVFCGSTILQVRKSKAFLGDSTGTGIPFDSCVAIVTSTGFSSTKGELFRSILYPKEVVIKFYQDSSKFLLLLSVIAFISFINNVSNGFAIFSNFRIKFKQPFLEIMVTSIDLVTIAVPPALPLVLTVGIGFALSRLKKSRIFCISPQRINFAGSVNLMSWDKTGTLTESHLSWYGSEIAVCSVFVGLKTGRDEVTCPLFSKCIASCHGINLVAGALVGHPVDMEMFKASNWTFHQDEANGMKALINSQDFDVIARLNHPSLGRLLVIKRFDFDAHIQRSTVICGQESGEVSIFCKGSPEAVRAVCHPNHSSKLLLHVLFIFSRRILCTCLRSP